MTKKVKLIFEGEQAECVLGVGLLQPNKTFEADEKLAERLLCNMNIKKVDEEKEKKEYNDLTEHPSKDIIIEKKLKNIK
jgi:hypothetical protein